MTALAALWDWSRRSEGGRCAAILEAQQIYGTSSAVVSALGETSLGRRLWALTAADGHDRGPVRGGGGTLTLTADARIDNRAQLIAALGLDPHDPAIAAEPALLMRIVERWGPAGLGRVIGPFAAIFWDSRAQRLDLVRDAMGERPLHYHHGANFVAVSSMPKGLHALPELACAANAKTMAEWLMLLPEGDETLFEGIARVLPGTILSIARGEIRTVRLWQPPTRILNLASNDEYAEALRAHLDTAVMRNLVLDGGRIGAQLSAGLDSAGVTATAARLLAPERLAAFTAVPGVMTATPRETFADEGPLAAATAAMYCNIEHVLVQSADHSPLKAMDRQAMLYDRPVLNPSNAVWSEAINDAAKARGVRVLLTGQFGNLTLSHAGFTQLAVLLRGGRLPALARLIAQLRRDGTRWGTMGAAAVGPYLPRAWWSAVTQRMGVGAGGLAGSMISRRAFAALGVAETAGQRGLDLAYRPSADPRAMRLSALHRSDMGVYNKGVLAGWGIDLRDPTADRELIEFTLAVPEAQFILGGVPRSLARRALADRLPRSVIEERHRGYQGADWYRGMDHVHGELAGEIQALDRCSDARELLELDQLRAALADWPSGGSARWNQRAINERYRHALLRALAAGQFLRRTARTN